MSSPPPYQSGSDEEENEQANHVTKKIDIQDRIKQFKKKAINYKRLHDEMQSELESVRNQIISYKRKKVVEMRPVVMDRYTALRKPEMFRWKLEIRVNGAENPTFSTGSFIPKFLPDRDIYWKAYIYQADHEESPARDNKFFLNRFKIEGNSTHKKFSSKVVIKPPSQTGLMKYKLLVSHDNGKTIFIVQSFTCKYKNLDTKKYNQGGNNYIYRSFRKMDEGSGSCVSHVGFKRDAGSGHFLLRAIDFTIRHG